MLKHWMRKTAFLALLASAGLMIAGCPTDSSIDSSAGGDPVSAAWKQVGDAATQAEDSQAQDTGGELGMFDSIDVAATDAEFAIDDADAGDGFDMIESEAVLTVDTKDTTTGEDGSLKLTDKASEFEVAELLQPGYHYIRARIVDRTRGATSGTLHAFRQAPYFTDRRGTLQANQGFRVITAHYAPGVAVNLRLTYRGRSLTKQAVGGRPPNPTNVTFEYVDGRLR